MKEGIVTRASVGRHRRNAFVLSGVICCIELKKNNNKNFKKIKKIITKKIRKKEGDK
jgi:hypothetical protein